MTFPNRNVLASSSGASTSSSMQKGEGLYKYMANNKAMAVSAFSPDDSCVMEIGFLPRGCAKMSMSDSKGFCGLISFKSQLSPA